MKNICKNFKSILDILSKQLQ